MKKTIGIITMHSVLNYGSRLQTYATYKYLEKLGYIPYVIDYKFPNEYHKSLYIRNTNDYTEPNWLHCKLNGLCNRVLKVDPQDKLFKFAKFYENIRFTKPYNSLNDLTQNPPKMDIYLTGSDQVWNTKYIGDDTAFLLSWVPKNKKKISYASSFGTNKIDYKSSIRFCQYLSDYTNISIREKTDFSGNTSFNINNIALDPTFLLNKDEWFNELNDKPIINGKYLLCYLLQYSFDPFPYALDVIKHIKNKTKLKVVLIDAESRLILNGYNVIKNCGPREFLNLFYYADFILTSSFHGTAFAINFNKNFISIIDNKISNDNRQVSIVNQMGLNEDCVLVKDTNINRINLEPTIFNSNIIETERKKSQDFLKNSLIK